MLGIDARAARAAWSVFLVALLLMVVYSIRKVLLVFVLAILFAYVLSPLVNFIARLLPWKSSRAYSLAVVYVLLVGILIAVGILIGNTVSQEASNLVVGFPKIVENLKVKLASPDPAWLRPVRHYILSQLEERAQSVGTVVLPVLEELGSHVASVVSSAAFFILIPILSFFFLKDGRLLRENVLSLTSKRRAMWQEIFADLNVLLGQFIRALVILAAAAFAIYSIFFAIIGLPYGVLVALVAALLEFVPVVGPLAAVLIIVLVAILSNAGHILLILGFIAVYRLFQDYVLSPHLMSSGIALHPLLVIFGALAGEEVAGIPGMFLSVPVLAALRVFYVQAQKAQAAPAADSHDQEGFTE